MAQSMTMRNACISVDVRGKAKTNKKSPRLYRKYLSKNGPLKVTFKFNSSRWRNYITWQDTFRFDTMEDVNLYMHEFELSHKQFLVKIIEVEK